MVDLSNKESDLIAQIERLELSIRDIRRRIEHAHTEADKRVLNRQISEMTMQIENLRAHLIR
jgi:outer membrane murein-binding lipoprotein Lpp